MRIYTIKVVIGAKILGTWQANFFVLWRNFENYALVESVSKSGR
jgi:hypothetical protein